MNRSDLDFLTKAMMACGVVMFFLTDVLIVAAYRQSRILSGGPVNAYEVCFVAFMPLLVGIKGFFSVKRLVSASNESDVKALQKLARLFSIGVMVAYLALIIVLPDLFLLLNLLRSKS
jgi:hypothetical protein